MKIAKLIVLSLIFTSCGISFQTGGNNYKSKYDVESVSEQALKEVLAAPTEFFVPISESSVAWDRARIFFTQFLKIPSLKNSEQSMGSNGSMISNLGDKNSKYIYQISRELFGQGYNFTVTCKTKVGHGTTTASNRNAKNVARFIRDGTLETSLLD